MINNNNIQNELQEENISPNRSQASNNEDIAPFKELSYDEFLYNKNKNKKFCSCCCVYKQYKIWYDVFIF